VTYALSGRPREPRPAFTCVVTGASFGARARAGPLPDRPPGDRVRAWPARQRLDVHKGKGADAWQCIAMPRMSAPFMSCSAVMNVHLFFHALATLRQGST
jgi:hypothetical protein